MNRLKLLALLEAAGARIGRDHQWIVLPRMATYTRPLHLSYEGRARGPFTSRRFALAVTAAANTEETHPNIEWEVLPADQFAATDAPLSPHTDHMPEGTCHR